MARAARQPCVWGCARSPSCGLCSRILRWRRWLGPRTCSMVPGPRGTAGFLLLLLTAKLSGSASLLCQPHELQLVPAGVGSKPCCSLKRWVFPLEKWHVSLSVELSRAPNVTTDSWKYSGVGNAKRKRAWGSEGYLLQLQPKLSCGGQC